VCAMSYIASDSASTCAPANPSCECNCDLQQCTPQGFDIRDSMNACADRPSSPYNHSCLLCCKPCLFTFHPYHARHSSAPEDSMHFALSPTHCAKSQPMPQWCCSRIRLALPGRWQRLHQPRAAVQGVRPDHHPRRSLAPHQDRLPLPSSAQPLQPSQTVLTHNTSSHISLTVDFMTDSLHNALVHIEGTSFSTVQCITTKPAVHWHSTHT
jgi:hypothetical protein